MADYEIELSEIALEGIRKHKKSGNAQVINKISHLLSELKKHPKTGTGKPEQLKGYLSDMWSRRITEKHRLIYEIDENTVKIYVINTHGHYSDK